MERCRVQYTSKTYILPYFTCYSFSCIKYLSIKWITKRIENNKTSSKIALRRSFDYMILAFSDTVWNISLALPDAPLILRYSSDYFVLSQKQSRYPGYAVSWLDVNSLLCKSLQAVHTKKFSFSDKFSFLAPVFMFVCTWMRLANACNVHRAEIKSVERVQLP